MQLSQTAIWINTLTPYIYEMCKNITQKNVNSLKISIWKESLQLHVYVTCVHTKEIVSRHESAFPNPEQCKILFWENGSRVNELWNT